MNQMPGIINPEKWQVRFYVLLFLALMAGGFLLDRIGDYRNANLSLVDQIYATADEFINVIGTCVVSEQFGPNPSPSVQAELEFCVDLYVRAGQNESWKDVPSINARMVQFRVDLQNALVQRR